ncbi:RICIN domain-containing protein [Actinoplanes utahensis]|uniref:Ricin B lectin domain-containing protein n=1 Tax=Actinoplanes utahensis TaxID=1869 RepID=A0A0A6UIX4_ACTUT|nr:RICIN domain-containing protein [Actinoplanes utahensis]KHD75028.1 hypothetical protein MB27_24945 [Actinoplanes utahensis]GIF28427.1 hypothetical protein Aut01nite_14130 [Actinoplanes utahensis]
MFLRGVLLPMLSAAGLLGAPATPVAAVPGPPPLHQGWIITEQTPYRCLTGGPVGTILHTAACDRASKAQDFYQTSDGHFTQNGNCVQAVDTVAALKAPAVTKKPAAVTKKPAGTGKPKPAQVKVMTDSGASVRVVTCTYKGDQNWWYTTTLQAGDRKGRCLTEVSVDGATGHGTVRLQECTGKSNQQWRSLNPW